MASIGSIDAPRMTLRIKVAFPRGYRIRMALLSACLRVAGIVAPTNIDVSTEFAAKD